MDLAEYGRVIRRQALVIGLGLALTLLLVLITLARVTSDGLVLRSPPVYQGLSTLLVSQRVFHGVVPHLRITSKPTRLEWSISLVSTLSSRRANRCALPSRMTDRTYPSPENPTMSHKPLRR